MNLPARDSKPVKDFHFWILEWYPLVLIHSEILLWSSSYMIIFLKTFVTTDPTWTINFEIISRPCFVKSATVILLFVRFC